MALDLIAALRAGLAGRYAVEEEIGRGGMAVVCRARDLANGREVAIKLLYPDLARAVAGERFLREIVILSRLSHPNILPLLDSGSIELVSGLVLPWYAMPLVREETLRARLAREGPLPLPLAIKYTRDLCAALSHAHAEGYVHRDIKPENILLSDGRAVLADFGIARAVTVAGGESLSSTGIVVGTPAYMSPEQSLGSPVLDGRSDLYSVGVVLYEMLAGLPPFSGATPQAVSARHQFEPPPPLAIVRPGLPAGLLAVVERSLAKVAADRQQSADELAESLTRALEPVAPGRSIRSRWLKLLLAAAAGVAALWLTLARGSPPVALDPSRFVVIPFHQRSDTSAVVSGLDCQVLVTDILGRIPDHGIVSELTVASALAEQSAPLTRERIMALARSYGAGRVVWGEVLVVGDTTRVTGVLYDAAGGAELRNYAIRIPRTETRIGSLAAGFAELTYGLVLPGQPAPETAADVLGAKSFSAWQEYANGDSALNAWNLPLAQSRYRSALTLDPDFPNANLKLAQVSAWLDDPSTEWRPFAARAAAAAERLAPSNRVVAASLLALADQEYPTACRQSRRLLRRDSLDFRAWFGLGECLARDDRVLPDSTSPSGWRFRTSYAEAVGAYRRALTLVPSTHMAYGGASLRSLAARLMTEPDARRFGRSDGNAPRFYAVAPALLRDTLAFVPYDAEQAVAGGDQHATWQAALEHNRRILLSITSEWLARFPGSRLARIAHSEALEKVGRLDGPDSSTGALGLIRGLRTGVSGENLELAAREVRLLTKVRRYSAARALAESALAVPPRQLRDANTLAGLASLIGRVDRAAGLLAEYPETNFFDSHGELLEAPGPVAREAGRLLAYASAGQPAESLRVISGRIGQAVERQIRPARRQAALDALQLLPRLLAFPALGRAPESGYPLATIEARLLEGDRDGARTLLDQLGQQQPRELEPYLPPDFGLLKARLWAAIGDSAEARRRVEAFLEHPGALSTNVLEEVSQAAAIGRMMEYCRALRCRANGAGLDSSVAALWGRSR